MIYLDYAATTPLCAPALSAMRQWLGPEAGAQFGNPASSHQLGQAAKRAVEHARQQMATALGAMPDEIIWTSGATEASNLAIKGAAHFYQSRGRHLVTSRIEHKSVLDTCRYLESQGWRVSYLEPDSNGEIQPEAVEKALCEDTVLVSLMWVNNELGVITDIPQVARLTRERGVLLHSDAAQAVGKLDIDLSTVPVDLLSVAAHKFYGPQGAGALFVRHRPRARLAPQMHGGGHQQGMRSGTLPVHQLVAVGAAAELAAQRVQQDASQIGQLRDQFELQLQKLEGVVLHASRASRAANYSNFHVEGAEGEALRALLPQVCLSAGSACSSATQEPSYVLRAIGLSDAQASASLRVSLGRATTEADLTQLIEQLQIAIRHLRFAAGADTSVPAGIEAIDSSYSAEVQRRLRALPCIGVLASPDATVEVVSRSSHARMALDVQHDGQTVTAARARCLGCPSSIATASYLAECVLGASLARLQEQINAQSIQAALELPVSRLHCALMAEDLIRELVLDLAGSGVESKV